MLKACLIFTRILLCSLHQLQNAYRDHIWQLGETALLKLPKEHLRTHTPESWEFHGSCKYKSAELSESNHQVRTLMSGINARPWHLLTSVFACTPVVRFHSAALQMQQAVQPSCCCPSWLSWLICTSLWRSFRIWRQSGLLDRSHKSKNCHISYAHLSTQLLLPRTFVMHGPAQDASSPFLAGSVRLL